jgi:hypothetical protein
MFRTIFKYPAPFYVLRRQRKTGPFPSSLAAFENSQAVPPRIERACTCTPSRRSLKVKELERFARWPSIDCFPLACTFPIMHQLGAAKHSLLIRAAQSGNHARSSPGRSVVRWPFYRPDLLILAFFEVAWLEDFASGL